MSDLIFIVLGFYTDGSVSGAETILCVFKTRNQAERFVELTNKTVPSKILEIVPMGIEP
jgi:hypothetical protein